jgi:hypothetical protein
MRAVLGIDAAWTITQPSGVALAVERSNGWRMIAAAASYQPKSGSWSWTRG